MRVLGACSMVALPVMPHAVLPTQPAVPLPRHAPCPGLLPTPGCSTVAPPIGIRKPVVGAIDVSELDQIDDAGLYILKVRSLTPSNHYKPAFTQPASGVPPV